MGPNPQEAAGGFREDRPVELQAEVRSAEASQRLDEADSWMVCTQRLLNDYCGEVHDLKRMAAERKGHRRR